MDVTVNATCRDDISLAANDLGARANDDIHTRLGIGVSSLSDRNDTRVSNPDIRFDDTPMIDDECIGHHRVYSAFGARALRLSHSIANRFTTAKLNFFAVASGPGDVVRFYLQEQVGVRQSHPIANRRAIHFSIGSLFDVCHRIP